MAFEDLRLFLPAQEALAALKILDLDADGKIFPNEMRDAVLNIYRERKHLASTLSVEALAYSEPPKLGLVSLLS